jgi:3-oxoadipate enol-lactonase
LDGFIETAMGRLHYVAEGEGQPLVLMHSNGASAHEFEENFGALAERFRVIAWDMPGHGDSAVCTTHMTIGAYSDALAAFLAAMGIDSAVVGGASVGATIAVDFAARYPARVRKLLLIEPASRTESWWAEHWHMVEWMFSIPAQSPEAIARRLVRAPTERLVQRWNIDRHKAGARAMMDVMWAGREYDFVSALQRIAAPVLLMFGEKSPVIEGAPVFKEILANAVLSILPGAGHFPMTDVPDEFNRVIVQFVLQDQART